MMITGRLRGLRVLVAGWRAPQTSVSRVAFRVLPTDVDLNVHLTNSRYPQLMDLGRMDLILRSGVGRSMSASRTWPVMVELHNRFFRELPLGVRFVVETQVTGRERRAVVFQQRFLVGDVVHAEARCLVVCLHGGKVVEPEVFSELLPSHDQVQDSSLRRAQ